MNSNCSDTIFVGDSEMAMLMRSLDWSQTLLGSVSHWKSSLKTAISICLNSRFPMVIWWGKDLVLLYNDAWRPILGTKHPKALGRPGQEVWSEIWDIIGVQLHSVLATAKATWSDDMLLLVDRYGYTEEAYFTYSYSPIFLETGEVGGAFTAVTETTRRVVGERRLSTLRELAANTVEAKSVEETCRIACDTLASNPYDIPFALLYLIEPENKQAQLVQTVRIDAGIPASPEQVDLTQTQDCWQLTQVNKTGEAEIVYDLTIRFGVLPGGAWDEPSRVAIALPIAQAGQKEQLAGFLVLGISPRREFDDEYRGFFDLVASNVATAIANAQAYEAERQRAEALAELDRAKTTFFSNISHEFRTPLTLIMSPLEELSNKLDGRLQPDEQEQLQLVQRNSLRLQKLVNTLLDFSRIEAGRMQASYEPTDLATYTAELASVFRSLIERAGMKLVIDCPPLPEQVYVDREMWEKIVLNLLSNAFKFTFAGSITVRLQPVGNAVELTVADTGVGIPETELPRLFERFHRVNGTRSRTYEGSGIGLALIQELVKLHGGSIRVTSQVDCGTTFAIVIPCGSAHLPSDQIQATRILTSTALGADSYVVEASRWIAEEGNREQGSRGAGEQGSRGAREQGSRGAREQGSRGAGEQGSREESYLSPVTSNLSSSHYILLVEDNADMRAYIKRLLSQYWDVETVSNGLAALEAIAQQLPDLVLSDVMMPGLDGFGLLRELRTNPYTKEIPVILLSARAGEESRIEGLQAGADDYLIKPFSARELLARVEATLKLAQLRREAARENTRAEAALRQSEEKLQLAITSARMVAWTWNASTDQIVRSQTACDILGLSPETLQGNGSEEWYLVHPDDRALHQAKVAEAIANHTNYISEFRVIRPDNGAVIWLQDRGQVTYDEQGNVSSLEGILFDITARKQAEIALRQALQKLNFHFENSPMAVIEWDGEWRFTRWAGAAERLFGWQADEVLGKLLTDLQLVFEEDIEPVTEVLKRLTIGDESYVFSENRNYTKGGDVIHCEWYNSSLRDQSGKTISILSLVLDVTERVRYAGDRERMLQQEQAARESAEAANRIKDEFLAVVSHELRSPLNPILGWSRLLRSHQLNEQKTAQALEVIERNAQMQAQLINDLLDVSRILRGKLSLDTKPVDLVFTIQAAMETVRLAAEAKSIQIHTQLASDVGYVTGDAGRLQQIVWNLLSNAVKFTPEGGRVNIRLERIDMQAQITVRDTGKGIPADFLPYVFEQFRQENSATTRRFGGLGLGLAIVRYLVELHGGTVQADSLGEGQGATFTVKLPLMPHQPTKNQDTKPFETALNLQDIRILIVDDDDSTREFIAFLLELHGANVIATTTAAEAITILTQFLPDVLLSDIGMPDVDGYMLMRQVRSLPPQQGGNIPAIALTAYAGEIDYRQAMAAGFQRHIPKPVEPQLLIQAIIELVPIRN